LSNSLPPAEATVRVMSTPAARLSVTVQRSGSDESRTYSAGRSAGLARTRWIQASHAGGVALEDLLRLGRQRGEQRVVLLLAVGHGALQRVGRDARGPDQLGEGAAAQSAHRVGEEQPLLARRRSPRRTRRRSRVAVDDGHALVVLVEAHAALGVCGSPVGGLKRPSL
jgi:hypothetical protein